MKTREILLLVSTCVTLNSCIGWEHTSESSAAKVRREVPVAVLESGNLKTTGSKYVGKVIQISAPVERIIAKGGAPLLILPGNVGCSFAKSDKRAVTELIPGQMVTVKGLLRWTSLGNMDPYVEPCVFPK